MYSSIVQLMKDLGPKRVVIIKHLNYVLLMLQ